MNKILNILLVGLFIIVVVGLIYLAIPKYQVNTVRINDNQILITKINTLTGQTSLETRSIKLKRFSD
jgi:cell division protein FtsL